MFACDNHSMAPCHRFPVRYALNHTQGLVTKKIFVHSLLPMERDIGWGVAGLRCSGRVDVDLNRWPFHAGQGPMRAGVKGGCGVSLQ